jgi:ribosomal protein S18 acetylase RimI-like enzyme
MPPTPETAAPVLRPANDADEGFLFELYAENRRPEFAGLGWSEVQLTTFLRMQYEARRRSYAGIASLETMIAEVHGAAAGTLSISREADCLHVVNIALRAESSNKGIGTRLLAFVISDAEASGKPVRLRVEKANRAISLYRRLGFEQTGDDGVYMKMERPRKKTL